MDQAEVEVETWDAIRARRNVRSYSGQAIASGDLDQILEAARRTPSARQPAALGLRRLHPDRPLTPIERPNRRRFADVVHHGHW